MRLTAQGPRERIESTSRRALGRFGSLLIAVVALAVVGAAADEPARLTGPLPAEKALETFRLQPGLRIELVAAEPMIESPVAIAFDERGRLFVAEDRGYPTGPGPDKPPVGRITMLEDTDGDGQMDRRTTFAEDLTYPNGLMPWKGGLIVTCAPDVFYLRDTDGDGKADERQVLFTGFDTRGSTQLRVSHPTLSPDNWVYMTSGLVGGAVTSPAAPDREPVVMNRNDFRFRPGGDAWEAVDGGSQFGLTFDEFGERFICYNRVQVQHVVLTSAILRRNPHLAFSDIIQNCPADMVPEPLKGHGQAARLFPISANVTTADSHAGTFTAACAVTVFRGTGLPDKYRGLVFSCDPTGNLVHVDELEPRGATFEAYPATKGAEFFASTDDWCRPVFLATGPDGALYVVDMYRKTIEHPDYLPEEIRKRTDFDSGRTMGRIWRIVRDDLDPADLAKLRAVDLSNASIETLCETLTNPNGWWVDAAQRLLLERKDPASVEPLRKLARSSDAPAVTVIRALRLLEIQDGLDDETLRPALSHSSPGVRRQALKIVEPRLADEPGWAADVLKLATDDDPKVRFETAIALGYVQGDTNSDKAAEALAGILVRDNADRWLRAAVFSSLAGREDRFLVALRDRPREPGALTPDSLKELGRLLAAGRPQGDWPSLVRPIVPEPSRFALEDQAALITGLAEAARGRVAGQDSGSVLAALIGAPNPDPALAEALGKVEEAMKRDAGDSKLPVPTRVAAIGLLGFTDFAGAGEMLLGLVDQEQPVEVQTAAVRSLAMFHVDRVTNELLEGSRFASFSPRVRDAVLASLGAQARHLPGLLTALETGAVPKGVIDALSRRQWSQSRDSEIKRRAEALFGAIEGDRAQVYEDYKETAAWKADPVKGREVFRRECATCHRLDREGFEVGPDLFGIRNQPKEAILLHILVPDQEITQGFSAYTVATKDGRVLTGLIASESPTSLTLRQADGKEDTIARSDVEELAASNQSLMPQGIEQNITKEEFADLLGYLKGEGDKPREDEP